MHYPAIFIPHEDGRYDVYFPDIDGVISQGRDLGHAITMAQEALSLHLSSMFADNDPVPSPSSIDGALALHVKYSEGEGAPVEKCICQFIPYIPLQRKEKEKIQPMHLSISLKPAVVESIDAMAEEMGLTRSGLITVATRDYIARMREPYLSVR